MAAIYMNSVPASFKGAGQCSYVLLLIYNKLYLKKSEK